MGVSYTWDEGEQGAKTADAPKVFIRTVGDEVKVSSGSVTRGRSELLADFERDCSRRDGRVIERLHDICAAVCRIVRPIICICAH